MNPTNSINPINSINSLPGIRRRHIGLLKITCRTLGTILRPVSQETATTFRDGPDGWTTVEVMGHLLDFDLIFRQRAIMMLEQNIPTLPPADHEALVIEHNYNSKNLQQVYTDFSASRVETINLFKGVRDEQWERLGLHPERTHFSITDSLVQVGLHDVNHIEQITRILAQKARA